MPADPRDLHPDQVDYHRFTGPQRLQTAVNSLHGLLEGVGADGKVSNPEVKSLIEWVSRYSEFENKHPFNELIPLIQEIVSDGVVDEEERSDLLWLCKRLAPGEGFYDAVTQDLQELHGFLAGVVSDGVVNEAELESLREWLDDHNHLRSCWPFDEVDSLVTAVMADGKIDSTEQQHLLGFFGQFSLTRENKAVGKIGKDSSVQGICAACPEIIFEEQLFCFTGSSERGARQYLVEVVEARGGRFNRGVRNDTNYLVIGAAGNPCWAYACYGRKVEDAIKRRQAGQRIVLVHEYDFWDEVGE